MLKHAVSLFVLLGLTGLVLIVCAEVARAEVVLSDDGREVRLNDDGSWEFVSEDRYATSDDGRRIRLKSDGSWEAVDSDDRWVQPVNTSPREDLVRNAGVEVELSGWLIESDRDKRKKNTTLRTQMIVELTVRSDGQFRAPRPDQLKVTDSRGRVYPVTRISGAESPGEDTRRIRFIADGAPRWFGIKFFRLEMSPGTLGLERAVRLTKPMSEVVEVDVPALTEF